MEITVEKISAATPEVVAGLESLLPHLIESPPTLSLEAIETIVSQSGVSLFVARDYERGIVGTVALVCFRIPSGRRGRIESLIVSPAARRAGVGRALCKAALEEAQIQGAETVDLTSGHARTEANALYRSLGFEVRATNTYRIRVCGDHPESAVNGS